MSSEKVLLQQIKIAFKEKQYLEMSLLLLMLIQFGICTFINFAHIKDHVGFDSSWFYLRTILMWREKCLVNPLWSEQTHLLFDNATVFAIPFYAITNNIFISFAIVNTIVIILLLLYTNKIITSMNVNLLGKLFAFNVILCPFMTNGFQLGNDIGYFSNILVGAAHTAVRTLIVLMIIYEGIKLRKTNRFSVSTFITLALCVLSGASIGIFLIIILIVPYIAYEVELVFIENTWTVLKRKDSVFAYLCAVCIVLGKALVTLVFKVNIIDASRTWTAIENIWKNSGLVIQGFMSLLNVLPLKDEERISIVSVEGLTRLYPIVIFLCIVIATAYAIYRVIKNYKDKDGSTLFILNIIIANFITFSLFNVTYGAYLFEDRYLLTAFFATILLLSAFIDALDRKKIYASVLCLALTVSLYGNDITSDINYSVIQSDYAITCEAISQYFKDKTDTDLIYVLGTLDNPFIQTTLRVYDTNHCYKLISPDKEILHFGDYTYYDNNSDYSGPTYLIVSDDFKDLIPEELLDSYTLLGSIGTCDIYYSDHNPVDYKVISLQMG